MKGILPECLNGSRGHELLECLNGGVESHEFAGICDGGWGDELMNYERNSIIIVS